MSDEIKKPLWPWIVALIGLPALYVASFGPACWLYNWKLVGETAIPIAYYPIIWLSEHPQLNDLAFWYATGGRCPAMYPGLDEDGKGQWFVHLPEREN
jgi:hypothetical protein